MAVTILGGKLLESMKKHKEICSNLRDTTAVTLFLYPSLLPFGVDQSLNLGRSTTIQTIEANEEEKMSSLEKVYLRDCS